MKKIFIISGLLFLSFGVTFCSNETSSHVETRADFQNKSALIEGILFTYTTQNELVDGITDVSGNLIAQDDENAAPTGTTDIINIISVSNGQGILSEKHYLDSSKGIIIESRIYNEISGSYLSGNQGSPIGSDNNFSTSPDCPKGSEELGSCEKTSPADYKNCIKNKVGAFAGSHQGQGISYQYKYLTNKLSGTTTICVKELD